jgi:hypothetical protein
MNAPYVISDVLTKSHIMHILVAIAFLTLQSLNFSDLFLHDLGLNFG